MAADDEPLVDRAPPPARPEGGALDASGGRGVPEPEPEEIFEAAADPSAPPRPGLASRVQHLEEIVERLAAELEELKKQLGV